MNSCFERHPQNCGTRASKFGRSIRKTWTLAQYNNKKYMSTPHQCVSDANSGGVQVSGRMFAPEGGPETGVNNNYSECGVGKTIEVSGGTCDIKIPINLNDKLYKTVVKPAMTYGSEC